MSENILGEARLRGRALATQFKTQMLDVLTVEQQTRLQELLDNPPEHALIFRKTLKDWWGEDEEDEEDENEERTIIPNPEDTVPYRTHGGVI